MSEPSHLRAIARRPALLAGALALLLFQSCSDAGPAAPVVELVPFVTQRSAELAARINELEPATERPMEPVDDLDPSQISGLLEFVSSSSGDLRRAGLDDLIALGPAVLPLLIERARDAELDGAKRAAAMEAVDHAILSAPELHAEAAVDLLIDLLKTGEEPWLRSRAAWYLGHAELDRCVPALVLRLKYEKDGETVVWLAQALSRYLNFAGLPGLIAVANDPAAPANGLARQTASELCTEFGFPSAEALLQTWDSGDPDDALPPPSRSLAFRAEILHWIARLDEYQLRGVDDARFLFERLDEPAASELAGALFDESPHVRLHAAQSLGRMGRRAAVAATPLGRALALPDLAPTAAEALGSVGFYQSGPELEARLAPTEALELRVAAARGLARLGLADSGPGLRAALAVPDNPPELRQALAEALAYSGGGPEAAPILLECIASPRLEPSTSLAALGQWLAQTRDNGPLHAAAFSAWRDAEDKPDDLAIAVEALLAAQP